MKLIIALLALFTLSCQSTTPSIYSIGDTLAPVTTYRADLKWSEFQQFLGRDTGKTCVYHLVDFQIDQTGKIRTVNLADSSNKALHEYSLAAVREWKYAPSDEAERKGRVAMVYTNRNDQIIYLVDKELPISQKINQDVENRLNNPDAPLPTKRQFPRVPREAIKTGGGFVIVNFDIQRDGSLKNIEIVKSFPPKIFDRATRRAMKRWKYEPTDKVLTQSVRIDFILEGAQCVF